MSFPVQKSVLLTTSLATDVQYSDGMYSIAGASVRESDIRQVRQIKYRANTAQVVTIGSNSYTPTASTTYTVLIGTPQRKTNGNANALLPYSYTTPADLLTLGATAALQREAIHLAVAAAINLNATALKVTAASLLTGTGFTITDTGSYYGQRTTAGTDNFFGATTIAVKLDSNGNGWTNTVSSTADATAIVYTTPAVYWSGVGANLAADVVVVDQMFGNAVSGMTTGQALFNPPAPLTSAGAGATSGQNYDLFMIDHLKRNIAIPSVSNITGFVQAQTFIFVDNGTGTSTSNLTGFTAFERAMLRVIFNRYSLDQSTIFDFFDSALNASYTYPTTGAAISTTDNVVMSVKGSQGYDWYVNPIGAHTLLTPIVTTGGLQLLLDVVDEEGIEFSAPNITQCPKEFVVGKSEYSFYARVSSANYLHLEEFAFGLRKKAAYAVNLVAYDVASTDFAALGVVSEAVNGLIKVQTSKAAGGVVASTTAGTWTSGAHDMLITVDITGAVRFYLDSVDVTSKQTTAYTFVAGTHLMPFIDTTLDANVDAAPLLIQVAGIPSINWRQ